PIHTLLPYTTLFRSVQRPEFTLLLRGERCLRGDLRLRVRIQWKLFEDQFYVLGVRLEDRGNLFRALPAIRTLEIGKLHHRHPRIDRKSTRLNSSHLV